MTRRSCARRPAGSRRFALEQTLADALETARPVLRDGQDVGDVSERRRALITGITGQDGSYLAELLLDEGLRGLRHGAPRLDRELRADRAPARPHHARCRATCSTSSRSSRRSPRPEPHEVYNLAAQSFVPTSWSQPVLTAEFTAVGVTRMLEAIRSVDPGDPLLPGLVLGDVRQGARGAAERADALLTRARPTAWPRSTATTSPSTTASPTACSPSPGSSSTTSRRGAGSSS